MNSLRGSSIRISVEKPLNAKKKNLFGTVIYERHGNKLIVKLSETIDGGKIKSDMLLVTPQAPKERFNASSNNYAIMVNGTLISEGHEEQEATLSGTLSFD